MELSPREDWINVLYNPINKKWPTYISVVKVLALFNSRQRTLDKLFVKKKRQLNQNNINPIKNKLIGNV
ncbi:hypothetical protein QYF56_22300 [Paenibacillus polymyxa]|nr:hypothetical protein [Paenibacillus polymyxa]MDN4106101.1 hypothetical protein [Paenibacillus polymyxa]